jgi:hypothetical protein
MINQIYINKYGFDPQLTEPVKTEILWRETKIIPYRVPLLFVHTTFSAQQVKSQLANTANYVLDRMHFRG